MTLDEVDFRLFGFLFRLCDGRGCDLSHRSAKRVLVAVSAKLTSCLDELLALGFAFVDEFRLCHLASSGHPILHDLLAHWKGDPYSDPATPGADMSEDLTQSEADALLALRKKYTKLDSILWPNPGAKISVDLVSMDEREAFLLDVSRASIKLERLVLQTRSRVTVVLVRLDIDGPGHRNPDDTEIGCPHIHLYREGYDVKWAFPVPAEHFSDLKNRQKTLADFMRYCSIVQPPDFIEGLF